VLAIVAPKNTPHCWKEQPKLRIGKDDIPMRTDACIRANFA
jgi:hypothetical protein